MIDFIKKLFIPKYKPMGQSRPCLAQTNTETKRKALIWVPKMKMIFALAASLAARTSKNKFYQPNSLSICQIWQSCFENTWL